MTSINPGSGPVDGATEGNAAANAQAFTADLKAAGVSAIGCDRVPASDDGEGRYAFTVRFADGRATEVQMPGLPLGRVRYTGEDDQNIWDFPRLYVNGDSWVWKYALRACLPSDKS